jgi:hypothetical protein
MAYEQRDNSGSVFVNDRKEKDSPPDRTGTARIDGKMYWVSGWLKQGAKGPFLSLAFKRKDAEPATAPNRQTISQRATPTAQPAPRRSMKDEADDEIPW